MDVQDEIYQAIDNMVGRRLDKQPLSLQKEGIVVEVSSKGDRKYKVLINGVKYSVRDGVGLQPQLNSSVWVCVPNNDWSKAYICAGKNLVIDPDDPSVGTHVEGNPAGSPTEELNKIKIAKTIYGIPVTDVRVNNTSVVTSRIANVSVPVTDVQVNGTSVMDGTIAKITGGGGDVADVYVNGSSVVDTNKIARVDLTSYATTNDLQTEVAALQASFQDGVDAIYDACVRKGSTPASHALADVVDAIYAIGGSTEYRYVQSNLSLDMRYFGHAKKES